MSDTGLVFLEAQEAQFDWTYMGTLPISVLIIKSILYFVYVNDNMYIGGCRNYGNNLLAFSYVSRMNI